MIDYRQWKGLLGGVPSWRDGRVAICDASFVTAANNGYLIRSFFRFISALWMCEIIPINKSRVNVHMPEFRECWWLVRKWAVAVRSHWYTNSRSIMSWYSRVDLNAIWHGRPTVNTGRLSTCQGGWRLARPGAYLFSFTDLSTLIGLLLSVLQAWVDTNSTQRVSYHWLVYL